MDACPRFIMVIAAMLATVVTSAFSQERSDQAQFQDLVQAPLMLSTGSECAIQRFEFDVRLRVASQKGITSEQRTVAQRNGGSTAIMFLSPSGFPSSYAVDNSICVLRNGALNVARGHFILRAGFIGDETGVGVSLSGLADRESAIVFDLTEIVQIVAEKMVASDWNRRNHCYWTKTAGGLELAVYKSKNLEAGFPAIAATLEGSNPGGSRLEMSIVVTHRGGDDTPFARSLFRFATNEPVLDLPMVAVEYDDILRSHFKGLGMTFDESDAEARTLSVALLRKLETRKDLIVSATELQPIEAWLQSNDGAEPRDHDALKLVFGRLRRLGEEHIWGPMQRTRSTDGRSRSPLNIGYERFLAAVHTEIAFGPEIVPSLHQRLAAIAADHTLPVELRCEALDLVGRFGLPPLSPVLAGIEESLAGEPNNAIQAALASVRVRQRAATDQDVARLNQALDGHRPPATVITQALEALAMIDELAPHEERLMEWVEADPAAEPEADASGSVPRRLRAVAAVAPGQAVLLDELQSPHPRLSRVRLFTALAEAVTPAAEHWTRLVRLSRAAALDPQRSVEERLAANHVVLFDADSLASEYTEQFYQSSLRSNDVALMYSGIRNMAKVGRTDECLAAIGERLASDDAQMRIQMARLLPMVGMSDAVLEKQLPAAFWRYLDAVFSDTDLEVRRYGQTAVLLLLHQGIAVPQSYVPSVVAAGLAARDPEHLQIACAALVRLTDGHYLPPFPEHDQSRAELSQWFAQNAPSVHSHLERWLDEWRSTQEGDEPR